MERKNAVALEDMRSEKGLICWCGTDGCRARDSRHVSRAEDTYGTPIRLVFAYSEDLQECLDSESDTLEPSVCCCLL